MKDLLKMIEAVEPSDTAMMDEIDFMVNAYAECLPSVCETLINSPRREQLIKRYVGNEKRQYTRSRDALKKIRPEGWAWKVTDHFDCQERAGGSASAFCHAKHPNINTPVLPTEELSELHAIIQAIAHERKV